MALLSWDGQIINALVKTGLKMSKPFSKTNNQKSTNRCEAVLWPQQLVQCGFSSRTCHTGDASRFTYESGDTLLASRESQTHHHQRSFVNYSRKGRVHPKNSKGETAEELDKPRMREAQRLFKLKPRAKKKKVAKKVEGNQTALVGATFGDVVGVANSGTKLARLMRSGVA